MADNTTVVVPIFSDLPTACQEGQVDLSSSCSSTTERTESETLLQSMDQNKWPRLADSWDDVLEDETMVEVITDWLNPTQSTLSALTNQHDQDEDAMWDDRLTALVNEIEEGLRDEEGIFDAYDDEMTEISESMTYGAEHVGSDDTLMEPILSEEETEEGNVPEDTDKKPLYPTSTVALGTIMVLLALFSIKHNLPTEAIGNLLSLISLVLPSSHCRPNTVSKFKNYFKKLKNPLCIHYYCSFCLQYIETKTLTVCPNGGCLHDLTEKNSIAYFVEIPILQQLKTFFKRPTFYEDLQYWFKRKKKVRDNVEDI